MKHKSTIRKSAFAIIFTSFLISAFSAISISQVSNWQSPQKLTSGYYDRNPSFGTPESITFGTYSWEFMVFERSKTIQSSRICVMKIDLNGQLDSIVYLTDSTYLNHHPSISYDKPPNNNSPVNIALALWESVRNGKVDIFGSYYKTATGWSSPFPIDTSVYNKSLPRSFYKGNSVFAVVYEKDNDIIYKHFNPETQTVSYDTNLTANDTSVCKNAFVTQFNYNQLRTFVSYESKKSDNKFAIEFKSTAGTPVWSTSDTIAYIGNNQNSGFEFSSATLSANNIFNSDRTGKYSVYATLIKNNGVNFSQELVVPFAGSDLSNFHSLSFPIPTDRLSENMNENSSIYFMTAAYIKKGNDSVKAKFITRDFFFYPSDSSTVGDTSSKITLTMNKGLNLNYNVRAWAVYNKDSASTSMLYGRYSDVIIVGIVKTGSTVPDNFVLYQNYPNPFNPVTKIKFGIPQNSFVKITIYDVLGKVIDIPVKRNLDLGNYEVTWDGSKFAGGVYFYRFETGSYSDVKKLILLK